MAIRVPLLQLRRDGKVIRRRAVERAARERRAEAAGNAFEEIAHGPGGPGQAEAAVGHLQAQVAVFADHAQINVINNVQNVVINNLPGPALPMLQLEPPMDDDDIASVYYPSP